MTRTIAVALALASLSTWAQAQGPVGGPPEDTRPPQEGVDPDAVKTVWEYLARRYDANGDGRIARSEYSRGDTQFARLDRNGNGVIEEADTTRRGRVRGKRGDRSRVEPPQEGALAPDFALETLYPVAKKRQGPERVDESASKGDAAPTYEVVKLSSARGKHPVALIFGSYT